MIILEKIIKTKEMIDGKRIIKNPSEDINIKSYDEGSSLSALIV